MRKFNSINKRNGRKFILTFIEGNDKVKAYDVEKQEEKEVSINTIKRWHEVGDEIKPEPKKKTTARKKSNKKNKGTDKRRKVTEKQVIEIRKKRDEGQSINSLAKEYGMSYSGMYWIVKGNTWAHLDKKEDEEKPKYYWYEYRLRGYSLGCQPKGVVMVDHDHGKYGAIAYKEPLTQKQIDEYELNPLKEGVTV